MTARCPNCQSTNVIPDQSPGGAGRNFCCGCKHTAPVRDFHQSPAPGRVCYAKNPPAAVLMPDGTFNDMRPLKTDTPPAPIRQYKDD